ncbi:hypothetical protein FRB99_003595 [Tulasnella sp. 403]|nr:hypothetical protein FRB99_003595 [Tulasnella sp. 403]
MDNSSESQLLISQKKHSHARKQPANHIPRPRNAFILFRTHMVQSEKLTKDTESDHRNISKIVGAIWRSLPPDQKLVWHQRAVVEKEKHQALYPDYRREGISRRKVKQKLWEGVESDEDLNPADDVGTNESSAMKAPPDSTQPDLSTSLSPPTSLPLADSSTATSQPNASRGLGRTEKSVGLSTAKEQLPTKTTPSHPATTPPDDSTTLSCPPRDPSELEKLPLAQKKAKDRCEVIAQLYMRGVRGVELQEEVRRREEEGRRKRAAILRERALSEGTLSSMSSSSDPVNSRSMRLNGAAMATPSLNQLSSGRPLRHNTYSTSSLHINTPGGRNGLLPARTLSMTDSTMAFRSSSSFEAPAHSNHTDDDGEVFRNVPIAIFDNATSLPLTLQTSHSVLEDAAESYHRRWLQRTDPSPFESPLVMDGQRWDGHAGATSAETNLAVSAQLLGEFQDSAARGGLMDLPFESPIPPSTSPDVLENTAQGVVNETHSSLPHAYVAGVAADTSPPMGFIPPKRTLTSWDPVSLPISPSDAANDTQHLILHADLGHSNTGESPRHHLSANSSVTMDCVPTVGTGEAEQLYGVFPPFLTELRSVHEPTTGAFDRRMSISQPATPLHTSSALHQFPRASSQAPAGYSRSHPTSWDYHGTEGDWDESIPQTSVAPGPIVQACPDISFPPPSWPSGSVAAIGTSSSGEDASQSKDGKWDEACQRWEDGGMMLSMDTGKPWRGSSRMRRAWRAPRTDLTEDSNTLVLHDGKLMHDDDAVDRLLNVQDGHGRSDTADVSSFEAALNIQLPRVGQVTSPTTLGAVDVHYNPVPFDNTTQADTPYAPSYQSSLELSPSQTSSTYIIEAHLTSNTNGDTFHSSPSNYGPSFDQPSPPAFPGAPHPDFVSATYHARNESVIDNPHSSQGSAYLGYCSFEPTAVTSSAQHFLSLPSTESPVSMDPSSSTIVLSQVAGVPQQVEDALASRIGRAHRGSGMPPSGH